MSHVCKTRPETIPHILSAYKWSLCHDRVLFQLVKHMALKLDLQVPQALRAGGTVRGWRHNGKTLLIDQCGGIMGKGGKTLLIDQCRATDRTMTEQRPDLLVN